MAKYRNYLPQLSGELYLTDGGLETTLTFHQGLELPYFAAFDLLKDEQGRQRLRDYFCRYIDIAEAHQTGFVLESATWRASPDWAAKLGYSRPALADLNRRAIELLAELREARETATCTMVISGCIGPRGDGYKPAELMNEDQAQRYHSEQIETFSETGADLVTAITMTHAEEAIGIARAAQALDIPSVVSFTVETDGKLPSGQTLKDAIEQVDLATAEAPAYYMINCAHPTHFADVLTADGPWLTRIRGLRANASTLSHAELDQAEQLDDGDPVELGRQYRALLEQLNQINILGGCCGTDHRHVEAICRACTH